MQPLIQDNFFYMKEILFAILLLGHFCALGQVDTLRSKAGIEAYLKHKYHYQDVVVKEVNSVVKDTVTVRPAQPAYWLQADFNHDGKVDLFTVATIDERKHGKRDALFILASNGTRYVKVDIPAPVADLAAGGPVSCEVYTSEGRDYLVMANLSGKYSGSKPGLANKPVYGITHDTLYLWNYKPMLYTRHPATQSIDFVKFSTTPCFGTCPVIQLLIAGDGTVSYKGIEYVNNVGDFNLAVPKPDLAYLIALLAAIKPLRLDDNYRVAYTDAPTVYLTVKYADGQIKKITDYGEQGTYGLAMLYNFLLDLRNF